MSTGKYQQVEAPENGTISDLDKRADRTAKNKAQKAPTDDDVEIALDAMRKDVDFANAVAKAIVQERIMNRRKSGPMQAVKLPEPQK